MKHWKSYRGTWQARNFTKQIFSLRRNGYENKQIADRINTKYSRYKVALSGDTVHKEIIRNREKSSEMINLLRLKWNSIELESIAA
jgi:hypothetical protein